MSDNGEAALSREVEACIEDEPPLLDGEHLRIHTQIVQESVARGVNPYSGEPLPDIERTDLAREAFRAKLAYWRKHGAPGYIGPRATRDS